MADEELAPLGKLTIKPGLIPEMQPSSSPPLIEQSRKGKLSLQETPSHAEGPGEASGTERDSCFGKS